LDLSRYALAAATTTSGYIGDKIQTSILHQSGEKNLIKYEKYENCPKRETCIHKFDTRVAVKGFCFYLAKSSGNQHLSTKKMTYLSESSGGNISRS